MSILVAQNLIKHYGISPNIVRALDGVNLEIHEKEFVAIVGMSGSGKSTLLNMLGGLDNMTSGKVIINGHDISDMTEEQLTIFRRRNIGFIFQSYNLVPILSVYDNIVLPVELDGRKADHSFVNDIVNALGIGDKLNAMPNMLSGGQQQRVAIARALSTKSSFVLADEPTGNLDSKSSRDVFNLLFKVAKEFNQTVIVITHNDYLAALADRVIKLQDGKIVAGGHN